MGKIEQNVGDRELELLRWIAENGPATVGETAKGFGEPRGLARTTVQTMLERLNRKQRLLREQTSGAACYRSPIPASDLLRDVVDSFVNGPLAGSISPFVAYLAESEQVTSKELAELEAMVERLQSKKRQS